MYFETSFRPTEAVSVEAPGVVVPNVDCPALVTVIVIGALIVAAPWLSVTLSRTV